ncbi:hypothetical protein QYE76_027817 [Lolium multiflorum]|uniref:Transposase (putative) gypsy type domain-containing protein n=1 Tax=Lolium multiflorum TaxID=4521 RepID=A0AAD8VF96_LOLMU|nr:hypothetical protein QYE76_027817 [Lolium multiflorum]
MAAVDLGSAEWERSKISTQDINLLKKLGISKKPKALCFPSEESYPTPPMGYRVSFIDHLIRGLSAPIHPFLRGLLFVYGLQLHHLTPNSILHISIFITLVEKSKAVVTDDNQDAPSFVNEPAILENLRDLLKRKLPLRHCISTISSSAVSPKNKRKMNDVEDSGTSKAEEAVPPHQKAAYDPYLEAFISSDDEEEVPTVDVAARTNKTSQEFELEDPDNDPLLDAISFLEFHGTEAREGIDEAKAGLSRLFSYFFPKKEEPATFLTLAKCFNPPEDLGLKMRRKI